MSFKDMWFAEMERELNELEDQGMDRDAAYERAGDIAYGRAMDRLTDMADDLRQRAKDGR